MAEQKHLSFHSYPDFESYVRYALKSDRIDKYALFDEIQKLKERAVVGAAKTQREREVFLLSEDLRLLRRML